MSYNLQIPVLFQHCDPAGIVFYPRYFEMVNQVVESWFAGPLGYSFARMQMQDGAGVPTVTIRCDFPAPSRLGDTLDFTLRVIRVGRTSCTLHLDAACQGEARLAVDSTLVHIDKSTGRPSPWPEPVAVRMRGAPADP